MSWIPTSIDHHCCGIHRTGAWDLKASATNNYCESNFNVAKKLRNNLANTALVSKGGTTCDLLYTIVNSQWKLYYQDQFTYNRITDNKKHFSNIRLALTG